LALAQFCLQQSLFLTLNHLEMLIGNIMNVHCEIAAVTAVTAVKFIVEED
jgi:hypothetical protein